MDQTAGKVYKPLIPNGASIDRFIAPDSTASRPNPESLEDRPRTQNQVPDTLNSTKSII